MPNILHDHPINNVVKKDWIHVEALKKEWRSVEQLAKAEPKYHINPYKKLSIKLPTTSIPTKSKAYNCQPHQSLQKVKHIRDAPCYKLSTTSIPIKSKAY